jgi:hypothetical protein
MSTTEFEHVSREVEERLSAEVLGRTASQQLFDHIARAATPAAILQGDAHASARRRGSGKDFRPEETSRQARRAL